MHRRIEMNSTGPTGLYDGLNSNCSSGNSSCASHAAESDDWRVIHPAAYAVPLTVAIVVTVFGNTLVVLSVLKFRKLRKQVRSAPLR